MKKDKNFELCLYEVIGVPIFIKLLFAVRDIAWNFLTLKEVPERFDKDQVINYTKNKVVNKVINWIRNRVLNPIIKCLFSLRDDVCHIFISIIPERNKKNHIFDKIKESYIYKIIHKLLDTYYYCSVNKFEDLKKARIYLLFRMLWCATHFFLIAFGIQKIGYNIFTLFPRASILYSFYNAYWVMFYRYNYVRCSRVFEKKNCYDLKNELLLDDFNKESNEYVRFNDFVATASISQLKQLRNYLKSLQVEDNLYDCNQTLFNVEISFGKKKKLKLRRK